MKKSNWSVAIYLFLVFASGVLVGGFGHRLYSAKSVTATVRPLGPEDYRKKYVAEARSRLELNPDQVQRLNEIMDLTGARFRELHERNRPERRQIHEEQVEMINAILSPDQQREYAKMREEREQERARRERRESPPPGR
jgi:hypothetical protein